MIIKLNMNSATPIYVQLRNQIVLSIGNNTLKHGDSLPTVRQLASDIGINMMTVNKAYGILKNEGFIEIDRRHGAKISINNNFKPEFKVKMEDELNLIITEASLKGYSKSEIMDLCNEILGNINLEINLDSTAVKV